MIAAEKANVQEPVLVKGDTVFLKRRPVSRDAVARDGDIRPRNKDDVAVAVFDEMLREPFGRLEVLALDGGLFFIGRLEGDERDVAADELAHSLGIVVAAQAKDAVQPQRTAVVEKASAPHLSLLGDEHDLEIVLLHLGAEAVQDLGKQPVTEAEALVDEEEHAHHIGALPNERTRRHVGNIAQPLRRLQHFAPLLFADVARPVEYFAHRRR